MPARIAASSSSGSSVGPAAITFWLPPPSARNWMNLTPRSGSSWRSTITSSGASLRSAWTCSSSNWANRTGASSARTTPRSACARAVLTWSENPGSVEISAARRLRSFMVLRWRTPLLDEPEDLVERTSGAGGGRAGRVRDEACDDRVVHPIVTLDEHQRDVRELDGLLPGLGDLDRIPERDLDHPRAVHPVGRVRVHHAVGRRVPGGRRIEGDQVLDAEMRRTHHVARLDLIVLSEQDLGVVAGADVLAVRRGTRLPAARPAYSAAPHLVRILGNHPGIEDAWRDHPRLVQVLRLDRDLAALVADVSPPGRVGIAVPEIAAVAGLRDVAVLGRIALERAVGIHDVRVVDARIVLPLLLALPEAILVVVVVEIVPHVRQGERFHALGAVRPDRLSGGLRADGGEILPHDLREEGADPAPANDHADQLAVGDDDDHRL